MTLLSLLGIIFLITIIRFARDSFKQSDKVTKEGGMRKKYSVIVNWLLEDENARIVNETSTAIMIGKKGYSGSIFDIVQTFDTVTIQCKLNNMVLGNHKLEWSFPEYGDQREMIKRIENDVSIYTNNVMSKFK